jgi:arylsulfatase A-like enzyme
MRGSSLLGQMPGDRPNIVVIMTDDMRDDELQWMPNVQRLIADRGVRFVNSFSPFPLCCPARASFITGQYTHNHGVWSNAPEFSISALDESSTIATDLAMAGYQTAFVGKYLNGYGMEWGPPEGGDFLRYIPPGWHDWRGSITALYAPGTPEAGGTYDYFSTTLNRNGSLRGHRGLYQTRVFGHETADLVHGLARSPRPFFLWSSFVAPHTGGPNEPDDPEPVTREDGQKARISTPARPRDVKGLLDDHIDAPPDAVRQDDVTTKPGYLHQAPPLNQAETDALTVLTRQRAESLLVVDEEVERIVASLEATGELDRTVLVFLSDNGYLIGEHGALQKKRRHYEAAIRIPLLIAGPGIPEGEVRGDPFLITDLVPTFLELAGSRSPRVLDGVSMLDVAREGDQGWTRPILTETGPKEGKSSGPAPLEVHPGGPSSLRYSQGVRIPRFLYVEHATRERELYDVRRDPRQLTNLVDRPAMADVVSQLAQVLDRLRTCSGESCNEPLPPALQDR